MKKSAFTLSEILIAMTLIAVIAVLVVPRFRENFVQKTQIVALQKTVKIIEDNIKKEMIDQRTDDASEMTSSLFADSKDDLINNFVQKYFSYVRECKDDFHECFATEYKNLSGASIDAISPPDFNDQYVAIQLENGASLCFIAKMGEEVPPTILIDTNGVDKPNVSGRDFFIVRVYPDGELSEHRNNDFEQENPDVVDEEDTNYSVGDCKNGLFVPEFREPMALGCFNHLMLNQWNLDY